ncbi:MAG: hypothetical protein AB1Z65_14195, partial [Candidatus Sulfomarinibacteraceae bacterium]
CPRGSGARLEAGPRPERRDGRGGRYEAAADRCWLSLPLIAAAAAGADPDADTETGTVVGIAGLDLEVPVWKW